jgi:hypothetical protein
MRESNDLSPLSTLPAQPGRAYLSANIKLQRLQPVNLLFDSATVFGSKVKVNKWPEDLRLRPVQNYGPKAYTADRLKVF